MKFIAFFKQHKYNAMVLFDFKKLILIDEAKSIFGAICYKAA
jgi:hypothetical protein